MYDQFYGFQGRPFLLTPDPHYYFESLTHRKALSYLGYGLAQGEGFIVITGEIGAGKTTLVGHLMGTIDPERLTAVSIVSSQVGGDDILRLAAQKFGIVTENLEKAQMLQQIEQFLQAQARRGLRTLLIVDEAQTLAISALEELRMLSNFQLGGQALLQIFLLGQPEFRAVLKTEELEQLRQRVIATHHLEPMMATEVEPYIYHRLRLVGWHNDPQFAPDAFAAIYEVTDGIPRRINALMSRVLLLGSIDQLHSIDSRIINLVAEDMGLHQDEGGDEDLSVCEEAPIVEDLESAVAAMAYAAPAAAGGALVELIAEEPVMAEPGLAASAPVSPVDVCDVVDFSEMEEAPLDAALDYVEAAAADVTAAPSATEMRALQDKVARLEQEVSHLTDLLETMESVFTRIDQIEARLSTGESRDEEQETSLRNLLTMLVKWVETSGARNQAA